MKMSGEKNEKNEIQEIYDYEEDESLFADGGWGWVIVAVSFAACAIGDGIGFSTGTLYVEIVERFNATSTEVTWIMSLMIFFYWFIGPVTSLLNTKFGARFAIIAGSITIAVGFVISAFAPNIYVLYVSMGMLAGSGLGLIYQTGVVMVNFYFLKRRGIANGIAVCGSGVGVITMPLIINWVSEEYGFQVACFVVAGITLLGVILGALVLTPQTVLKMRQQGDSDAEKNFAAIKNGGSVLKVANLIKNSADILEATTQVNEKVQTRPIHRHLYRTHTAIVIPPSAINNGESENGEDSRSAMDHLKAILQASFDVKLLKTGPFRIFILSQCFMVFSYSIPFIFLPAQAISFGFSSTNANLLISVTGISGIVGRIVCGVISDTEYATGKSMYIYVASFMIGGMATAVNFGETLVAQMAYASILGLCIGCGMCVYCLTIADIVGVEKLSQAYGMSNFISSFASLLGPFFAGWIFDTTKSFEMVFACGGVGFFMCGAVLLLIPCISCCRQRRSQDHHKKDAFKIETNLAFTPE